MAGPPAKAPKDDMAKLFQKQEKYYFAKLIVKGWLY